MHTAPVFRQAVTSSQRARCVESDCSRRELVVHSPKEPRIRDPDGKSRQFQRLLPLRNRAQLMYLLIVQHRLSNQKFPARGLM